jgi:hypothetical protein
MKIVAIHQSQYLPWVPYFDKADVSDTFVYLDNVQYDANGVQNRNQIKTAQGAKLLTVPVYRNRSQKIKEVRIAGTEWQKKHIRSIELNYSHARFFELFNQGLRQILESEWEYLVDLNIAVTEWMFKQLGIRCTCIRASTLGVTGSKNQLNVAICMAVGATIYYSGQGARVFQDDRLFEQHGIEMRYQSYCNQPYPQCFQQREIGFLKDLSALDLILNMGPEARGIMIAGRNIISP